jgi:hypothetical protein
LSPTRLDREAQEAAAVRAWSVLQRMRTTYALLGAIYRWATAGVRERRAEVARLRRVEAWQHQRLNERLQLASVDCRRVEYGEYLPPKEAAARERAYRAALSYRPNIRR